jgi:hypothetical protein
MEAVREEDQAGAVCYLATGELYLGYGRGRMGNEGGFKEGKIGDYSFAGPMEENLFYADGRWASTAEYFEAVENDPHTLRLKYEAAAVNLVMACPHAPSAEVILLQDGKPITRKQASRDTRFRWEANGEESFVLVNSARMYFLLDNHEFGAHELELRCSTGVAAFAFTFTSCVDPVASALQAASPTQP